MLTVLKDGNGGDDDDENRAFSHENFACTPFSNFLKQFTADITKKFT